IVNLAFGLTLGAVAVAFALAFGLGGREPAARLLDDMLNKAKVEANKPKAPTSTMSNADMEVPLSTSMGSPVVSPAATTPPTSPMTSTQNDFNSPDSNNVDVDNDPMNRFPKG
ncbi:hypothetical protein RJJ65_39300, partial [Rhizobium hidalgonense]